MATDRQLSYIDSLLRQRQMTEEQRDYLAANADAHPSLVIETLLEFPRMSAPAPVAREIPKGIYYVQGVIYKVQISQTTGRPYAKMLDPEQGWLYNSSYIRAIPEDAVPPTFEQMFAFGHMYGMCGNCGKLLTDPDSIHANIGPVCAKNLYGLTPKKLRLRADAERDRLKEQEDAGIWVNPMHP